MCWAMEREESVIAVVSHGFTMNLTFSKDAIGKVFAVDPADLDAVRLQSSSNTATHELSSRTLPQSRCYRWGVRARGAVSPQ